MPGTALTGSRIREQRMALGMRQAELAARAEVSASYLNLIEHNRRRVAGAVLARLAQALGLEARQLEAGAQDGLTQDLRSAVASCDVAVEIDRLEEFAGRYPGWAGLVAAQYKRGAVLERSVEALNDRMTHDPHLSATLHEVLSALSSVRATAGILAETDDLEVGQRQRFQGNLQNDAERLAVGAGALVAYLDGAEKPAAGIAAPQEELEAWLELWGWHLAEVDAGGLAGLEAQILGLPSPAARILARAWVAQAVRDAEQLPLAAFRAALVDLGPDPGLLAQRFGVAVLAVFRRLAMLPGSQFGLVVCDGSGTMTYRRAIEGFVLPRFGGACPLWPIYTALSRPMSAVTAVVDMAGRVPQRFGVHAFCQVTQAGGFGGVELREAAMLIWPEAAGHGLAGHGLAGRAISGHAIAGNAIAGNGAAVAVGSTCRICARAACPARREPSILTEAV